MAQTFWEAEMEEQTQNEAQSEAQQLPMEPAALTVSVDDFSALEERILRTVELVKQERQARAAAEERAAQAEAQLHEQAPLIEQLEKELHALRSRARPCAAARRAPAGATGRPGTLRYRMAQEQPGNATDYVTVEIYDQTYHLSGQDAEHIRELAARVDAKMRAVAAQGRTVDSLRVAVLAALNLADELSQAGQRTDALGHARAASLRGLLDEVLEEERKTGS